MKITSTYTDAETLRVKEAALMAGKKPRRFQRDATLAAAALIPTPAPRPAPAPVLRGATMGLSCWGSPENMDRVCDLGLGWVRVSIEQGWAYEGTLAKWVRAAHDRGLKVIQACQRSDHTYPASERMSFANWCAYLAADTGVDAIEILNEPNISQFWGTAPDPVAAAFYGSAAALTVRAAHPTIPIVTPGLSPAPKPDWPAGFWPQMWMAMTDAGKAAISGVGHHPYCYPDDPHMVDPDHPEWNASWQTGLIHAAMETRGIGRLPIWCTEFGSPTASFASEDQQAEHMAATFSALGEWQRQSPGLVYGPMFVHTAIDGQGASVPKELTMGMFRADGTRKPVGDVVAARAREVMP